MPKRQPLLHGSATGQKGVSMKKIQTRKPSQPVSPPARATNPAISFMHSTAMMGDERWEEAITALRRFLELDHDPTNRQMAYYNLGSCYLALERFDEALAVLDEVQQMQPVDPEVTYSRGVIYGCASRFSEAIAAFESYRLNWHASERSNRPCARYATSSRVKFRQAHTCWIICRNRHYITLKWAIFTW